MVKKEALNMFVKVHEIFWNELNKCQNPLDKAHMTNVTLKSNCVNSVFK